MLKSLCISLTWIRVALKRISKLRFGLLDVKSTLTRKKTKYISNSTDSVFVPRMQSLICFVRRFEKHIFFQI